MIKQLILFCTLLGCIWCQEPFTLDEFIKGDLVNNGWNGEWISDKSFIYQKEENYRIFDADSNTDKLFLEGSVLENYKNPSIIVSFDQKYILIRYNAISVFRHSTTAQFAIYQLETKTTIDIQEKGQLQYCNWIPNSNEIVYVFQNNIYYIKTIGGTEEPITTDGKSGIIYNGVPDWVYEEEVLSSGSALWFSPTGKRLAFAHFDDTNVQDFTYSIYDTENNQYPTNVNIKYPKVGTQNPKFKLMYTNLQDSIPPIEIPILQGVAESSDNVLVGVTWMNEDTMCALVMNRIQNEGSLVTNSILGNDLKVLNSYEEENGWLELSNPQFINEGQKYFQIILTDTSPQLYLIENENEKKLLTEGNRTITSIHGWDENKKLIYFSGSKIDEYTQQHVYRLNPETNEEICLTCEVKTPEGNCTYAQAAFSKTFKYSANICRGPGPTNIDIINLEDLSLITKWEENDNLRETLNNKLKPIIEDTEILLDSGFVAFVRLLLPPGLNQNQKYPAVVEVYAGPNSNQIQDIFSLGFENYIVTNKEYIYIYIDARGSGRRGKDIMFEVYKKLGTVEIEDQIEVMKKLIEKYNYIDANKIGIWGWSYGGFSTAWTMVKDTENVFKFGLSVAPVTDFKLYDSIYTERYMGSPEDNVNGYNHTDVTQHAEAFKDKNFFLIHGNGDDNVHYQQAMLLSRALELADIPFLQISYPDENHSLGGVKAHLYHAIDKFWTDMFTDDKPDSATGLLPSLYIIFITIIYFIL